MVLPMELSLDEDVGEETLDDDVKMADAELMGNGDVPGIGGGRGDGGGGCEEIGNSGGGGDMRDNAMGGPGRKWNKKKRKKCSSTANITDINRFVINTCKRLKENKSYLVWNAVGCLGISAMMDLVKEVDAIQRCGGQKTADGKQFRTGGGVLWNILKSRDPKAYKEIMAKGKELEMQFRQPKNKQSSNNNVAVSQAQNVLHGPSECQVSDSSENLPSPQNHETSERHKRQSSVVDRIRVPVVYDDLLEEGEIYEP